MDESDLRTLAELLRRPGMVADADGIPVVVRSAELSGSRTDPEVAIRYSVHPLPDGEARQPLPSGDLADYAEEVAAEVHAWATEHVRRFRPLPPPDRDAIRRDLPAQQALWEMLVSAFADVEVLAVGFRGRSRFDQELTVVITPEQWQEHVVAFEIACRTDYGVDADRPGSGPALAIDDLDEALATMDSDEHFLVLDGHRLVGSTRAGLPPTRGTARARELDGVTEKVAESRRRHPDERWGWFAYGPDGQREWFADSPDGEPER